MTKEKPNHVTKHKKQKSQGALGIKVYDKDKNLKEEYRKIRIPGEGTIEEKRKKKTTFKRVDKDE